MVYNTERWISSEGQNSFDKGRMSVGSKSSNKVASDNKSDPKKIYDGITNVQEDSLVDGTESNGLCTLSNSKNAYSKTTLRSRKKMFSRAVKQGLTALRRKNDEAQ